MRASIIAFVLSVAVAPALAAVEKEPTLPAARLAAPGSALSGPGWRVDSPVPVRGYLGQFTLRTPQGDVPAQGREVLAIRIAEIPALARLEEVSRRDVFAGAIADSAKATGRAVTRVVTNPGETIRAFPRASAGWSSAPPAGCATWRSRSATPRAASATRTAARRARAAPARPTRRVTSPPNSPA